MISLSTSCLDSAQPLSTRLERLFSCPVHGHELCAAGDAGEMREFARAIRRSGRSISNVVDPCPSPAAEAAAARVAGAGKEPGGAASAGGAEPELASLDRGLSSEAIRRARETMEWAARVESGIVVLRCGATSARFPHDRFRELRRRRGASGEEAARLRRLFASERRRSAPQHLDAVFAALDELLEVAERLEISIALALPRCPAKIPSAAELETILREFHGARIGAWYRSAHASYQDRLGFGDLREQRTEIAHATLGAGVLDLTDDDRFVLAGEGELDLRSDLAFLPPAQPLVVEATPAHDVTRIAGAVALLRAHGFEGPPPEPCEPFPIIGQR
ncbi:MAG: hypothetical protein L0Z55_06865 [Planctomycetes bacterium]|nr:hypothetical protein [Planctomycetota bacterium]